MTNALKGRIIGAVVSTLFGPALIIVALWVFEEDYIEGRIGYGIILVLVGLLLLRLGVTLLKNTTPVIKEAKSQQILAQKEARQVEIDRRQRLKTALINTHGEELGTALFEQEMAKLDISRQTLAASDRAAKAAAAPRVMVGWNM